MTKKRQGGFRCMPVVDQERLVGIVTDRDLRRHTGYLDQTEAGTAMSAGVVTVTPATPVEEAARLLLDRKIGGLPVLDGDQLVGVITTSDVLKAFVESE